MHSPVRKPRSKASTAITNRMAQAQGHILGGRGWDASSTIPPPQSQRQLRPVEHLADITLGPIPSARYPALTPCRPPPATSTAADRAGRTEPFSGKVYAMSESDLSALRERAARGDNDAGAALIELAAEREDFDELRRLADGGSKDAEDQLVELAAEKEDFEELRRLASAGNTDAAEVLAELTGVRSFVTPKRPVVRAA